MLVALSVEFGVCGCTAMIPLDVLEARYARCAMATVFIRIRTWLRIFFGAGSGRDSHQMIRSSIVDTRMPRRVQPAVRYQFEFTSRRIAAVVGAW